MSDSASSQNTTGRRPPKVGVYVPRHRRGNDPDPAERLSSSIHARQNRNNSTPAIDGASPDDSSSSTWPTGPSSTEVQRRGRGKFLGPGGGQDGSDSSNNNNTRRNRGGKRDSRPSDRNSNSNTGGRGSHQNNGRSGPSSSSAATSLPQGSSQPSPGPKHTPRGRDFDATVLRRYSDDENRPNSTFSRSGSYSSAKASDIAASSNSRTGSTRGQESNNLRRSGPGRNEQLSWRRDDTPTSPLDDMRSGSVEVADLVKSLEHVQLSGDESTPGGQQDGSAEEELEEWELALQDSDEESIPRIENFKGSKTSSSTSENGSGATKTPKIGNWSDVVNDDMYILELYDFSPTIKTMHLTDMFSAYESRSGGFRIKWVDDTKALVIFESAAVAKQAYIANLYNQIARIKPYAGADKDSIRNAGKPSSGAYNAPRPAKTDSVARRLVQGALGLRVRRTPEQIAEEKALVQAAKEARDTQRQEQQKQQQEQEKQRRETDAMFDA